MSVCQTELYFLTDFILTQDYLGYNLRDIGFHNYSWIFILDFIPKHPPAFPFRGCFTRCIREMAHLSHHLWTLSNFSFPHGLLPNFSVFPGAIFWCTESTSYTQLLAIAFHRRYLSVHSTWCQLSSCPWREAPGGVESWFLHLCGPWPHHQVFNGCLVSGYYVMIFPGCLCCR